MYARCVVLRPNPKLTSSAQGEKSTAAAGSGSLSFARRSSSAAVRWAPAEPPATTMFLAGTFFSSACVSLGTDDVAARKLSGPTLHLRSRCKVADILKYTAHTRHELHCRLNQHPHLPDKLRLHRQARRDRGALARGGSQLRMRPCLQQTHSSQSKHTNRELLGPSSQVFVFAL